MNQPENANTYADIINPANAVNFNNHIFKQKLLTTKEDWLLLNTTLIEDMGAKTWLSELLDVLFLNEKDYDGHDVINPSIVIPVSESFQAKHDLNVSCEQWIDSNETVINKIGAYKWLNMLLDILESDK